MTVLIYLELAELSEERGSANCVEVVLEYIGTERKKDTSILLKEMKVVESYDESEGDGLK